MPVKMGFSEENTSELYYWSRKNIAIARNSLLIAEYVLTWEFVNILWTYLRTLILYLLSA